MIETQTEATDRWRREGRDRETRAYRKTIEDELKATGLSVRKARAEAWARTMAAFPPLPAAGEGPGAWSDWDEKVGQDSSLPESWGTLPDSASFDAEVEWVHQNRVLVVEDRKGKQSVFHWDRAKRPPPSYGAVNLMEFAATNRKGFMDILYRVKPGMGGDEEVVRQEKIAVEEIRRLLEELRAAGESERPSERAPDASVSSGVNHDNTNGEEGG